jgi:hypothetical protein
MSKSSSKKIKGEKKKDQIPVRASLDEFESAPLPSSATQRGKKGGSSKQKVAKKRKNLLEQIWEERDEQMQILKQALENRRKEGKKGGEAAEDIFLESKSGEGAGDAADDPESLCPDFKALLRRARGLTKERSKAAAELPPPPPSSRKVWEEASKRREDEIANAIAEVGVDETILEFESEEVKREFQEARERQAKGEKVDMEQIIDPMMREVHRRRAILRERLLKQAAEERKEKEDAALKLIAKTEEDVAAIKDDNEDWEKGRVAFLERRALQKRAPKAYMEQSVAEQREVIVKEREKSDYKYVEDPGYTHAVVSLLNKKWPGVSSPKPQFIVWRLFHNHDAAEKFRQTCQKYKTVDGIRNYPDGFIYIVIETNQPYLISYSAADYGTEEGRARIAEKTDRVVGDYYEYHELNRRRSRLERDLSKFAAFLGRDSTEDEDLARREVATMQKLNLYRQRAEEIDKRQRAIEKWKLKRLLDMKKRRTHAQNLARERLAKVDAARFQPRTQEELNRMDEDELLEYAVVYKEAMKQRIEAAKELKKRGKLWPGAARDMGIVLEEDNVIPMQEAAEGLRPSVQIKTEDDYHRELFEEDDVEPAAAEELDARDREIQEKEMKAAGITQEYDGDFLKPDPRQQFFIGSVIYDATTREDNPELPEAARKEHVFYVYDAFATKEDARQFITWNLSRMVDDMPLDIYKTCCGIAPDNLVEQDAEEYHIDGEQKRMSDAIRDMQNRVLDYHRAAKGKVSMVVVEDRPAEKAEVLDLEESRRGRKLNEEEVLDQLRTTDEYMREIDQVIAGEEVEQERGPASSGKKEGRRSKLPTAAQTAQILGIDVGQVTKNDRRKAKAILEDKNRQELEGILFGSAQL